MAEDETLNYSASHRREAVKAFRLNLQELQPGRGIYYVIVVREPTGAPTPEEPPNSATTAELCNKFLDFNGSFITDIRGILQGFSGLELAGIEQ